MTRCFGVVPMATSSSLVCPNQLRCLDHLFGIRGHFAEKRELPDFPLS